MQIHILVLEFHSTGKKAIDNSVTTEILVVGETFPAVWFPAPFQRAYYSSKVTAFLVICKVFPATLNLTGFALLKKVMLVTDRGKKVPLGHLPTDMSPTLLDTLGREKNSARASSSQSIHSDPPRQQ
jgi:hypothetical protein